MAQKSKIVQLLNSLEIKKYLNDEEKAFLMDKKPIFEIGIKEEFPKSFELLSKLGKIEHYIYPKTMLYNKIESELLIKGYRNTVPQEMALNETTSSIINELKSLEKLIEKENVEFYDLFMEYFDLSNLMDQPIDEEFVENDKYDMDKNAIIISDSE